MRECTSRSWAKLGGSSKPNGASATACQCLQQVTLKMVSEMHVAVTRTLIFLIAFRSLHSEPKVLVKATKGTSIGCLPAFWGFRICDSSVPKSATLPQKTHTHVFLLRIPDVKILDGKEDCSASEGNAVSPYFYPPGVFYCNLPTGVGGV